MRKQFFVSFVVVLAIFASTDRAEAQWGWGPYGNSAGWVVAGNQAMVWQIARSWQQPIWQPWGGTPSSGMRLVCRPMSVVHEIKDIAYMAANFGGFGGRRGAITGAGWGGYGANHERQCWYEPVPVVVFYQPVQQPAPQAPLPAPAQPPKPRSP